MARQDTLPLRLSGSHTAEQHLRCMPPDMTTCDHTPCASSQDKLRQMLLLTHLHVFANVVQHCVDTGELYSCVVDHLLVNIGSEATLPIRPGRFSQTPVPGSRHLLRGRSAANQPTTSGR